MKKIFNLVYISVLAGFLLLMFSCEDFLTKEPLGVMGESAMETDVGVEGLLISAYAGMRGYYWEDHMVTDMHMGSLPSDDTDKGSTYGDGEALNLIERWEVESSNGITNDRFSKSYFGVARANSVLESLWKNQQSEDAIPKPRATEIEAEAKFLRAWFHFKAAKNFRYIPYVLTETESGIPPNEVTNDTEGWDEIEADLKFAIENLPESKPKGEVGRIDRYGAKVVKAHVHLFQNEHSQAKALLDDIINSGKYKLVDNYYDNYNMATENNEESIWEFQASTSATNYVSNPFGGPSTPQKGPAGVGWGFTQPSQSLFEAFQTNSEGLPILNIEDREPLAHDMGLSSADEFYPTDHLLDPRVDWTIARRGVDYLGWGIFPGDSWIRDQSNGGPYMTKKLSTLYENRDLNLYGNGHHNGKNWRYYRFSHVLLWRAEVAVEENDLDYARQLVNQIRKRAKESPVVMGKVTTYSFGSATEPEVDWDQPAANYKIELYPEGANAFSSIEEARKAVRVEIRLEFATEAHRFYDLRRWGIDGEVLNAYQQRDIQFRPFLNGAQYNPERDAYWPLPLVQLDLLPALKQDPAYN